MTMKSADKRGFTLLEVIIVLLITGILAALMLPFFGRNLTGSTTPIFNLQNALGTVQVMENITSVYALDTSQTALNALQNQIDSGVFTPAPYTAATAIIDLDPANTNDPVTLQVIVTNNNTGDSMLTLFTAQ